MDVTMRTMNICSPCPRPLENGPIYLNFLVNCTKQTLVEQVEAFTLGLEMVLQDLGKLPQVPFHVVGVDSDENRFVLELIVDGCKSQSSRAIFDTVEKLAEEQEKDKYQDPASTMVYRRDAVGRILVQDGLARCMPFVATMDRMRGKNPCIKDLDSIFVGDCHHPLCLGAKKAMAVAVEKKMVAENKCAELQAFEASRGFLSAQQLLEEKQIEFCTAELGFRRAEESLALAKQSAPQCPMVPPSPLIRSTDLVIQCLEERANEEKAWWTPIVARTYRELTQAKELFEALETKRQSLTLEAATSAAAAKFAQVKADNARQMCIELCGGAECSCFISYIQMEEYYASQLPELQFKVNAGFDVPAEQYYARQVPDVPFEQLQEGFFQLPETVTYMLRLPQVATITTTSTEIRRVSTTDKDVTKEISLYSTQDSCYSTVAGFQKGNSVSIPIVSRATSLKADNAADEAGEGVGLLQAC
jgi:hypothetical protein